MRSPEELREDKSVFMNQGEWELLHILSKYKSFSVDEDDYYAEMKFHVRVLHMSPPPATKSSNARVFQVVIRRRPLFYTVNLLLPSIFLMLMDIVGFYLPPDSGERVSFKITLLLGYSVFLIIVSDTLPATAIGTPLIGEGRLRLEAASRCSRSLSALAPPPVSQACTLWCAWPCW